VNFKNWCKGNYRKIYAFEPDLKNYNLCLLAQEKYEISNLVLINKGLWDCEETLYFEERANQGSRIDCRESNATIQIDTISIDQMVVDEKVTFIKLDVEGAELKALQGARNTIIKNHPKLAISIYHKDEDVITIPEYILSLSEEYRFYLRHYQLSANETILYAV
jgi:FkbM family methyltransferase